MVHEALVNGMVRPALLTLQQSRQRCEPGAGFSHCHIYTRYRHEFPRYVVTVESSGWSVF